MKRNLIIAASVITAFAGISCEKHRWNDKVEIVEEKIYDEDGNVIQIIPTEVVPEGNKGTVRFFKEEHSGHGAKGEGKPHAEETKH